ncbi:hypothetical protein J3F83DRAFT_717535 [Trichoderma novae-zelandiae]
MTVSEKEYAVPGSPGSDTLEPGASIQMPVTKEDKASVTDKKSGNPYLRIFDYAGPYERFILAVSIVAAIASGAGIALQNLVFGNFVTTITAFVTDPVSGGAKLRHEAGKLA